jgi:DNA-binding CsgD family transcriptional regulator/tetratricopeptide (TPR) repeat protein
MKVPAPVLLERESELTAIESSLRGAAAGEGGLLLIEGEAGAGKTVLLREGLRRAEALGARVLRARGGEYEREFPYGVVRQLFEPVLDGGEGRAGLIGSAAMAAPAFEGTGAGDSFSIQHGLYWLVAELTDAAPLVIAVDDAQWADAASLQALLYIGRRLPDMRAALTMTVRTGEDQEALRVLDALRGEPHARLVKPKPLSVAAVTALATEEAGWTPSDRFAGACRAATGGNPFLLAELFRALTEEEVDPTEESPERLARLAAAGASGAILGRLARLGRLESDIARAVAILEPRAEVRLVAQLSGHPVQRVAEAGARLVSAALLSDGPVPAFAHPLVREAVLTDMGESVRRAAHARAARLLDDDGADLDTIAAHLLLAEPMGDAWVLGKLRDAAASATARGAPEAGARYLRRALEEPPPPAQRIAVKRELGITLLRGDDEDGIAVLREVHALAGTREERAEVAAVLSNSLMFRAQHAEAEAILHEALHENAGLTDRLGINLHLHLLLAVLGGFERPPARYLPGPDDEVDTDLLEGRAMLSQAALLFALGLGPMSAATEFVARVGFDTARETADARAGYPDGAKLIALSLADRGDEVFGRFGHLLAGAAQRGTLGGVSGTHGSRAYCHLLDGELSEAQVDAETAIRISVDSGFKTPLMSWLGAAAPAMTARGEAEAAVALIDRHTAQTPISPGLPGAMALIGRGQALAALARHAEACEDFRAAGARLAWIPWANPEGIGWRPGLALSLAALGQVEEARQLAAECVELAAEAGGRRGIGVTYRVIGLIADGEESVEALRSSVALLAETRAKLQHAQSLIELGAALRRANCRREAREPLAEGLDLAHRCGAAPLEERARTELAAAGARPRHVVRSGVEALTPSELRIAQMAATGATNREIAQLLVVSTKTVETHLRHVFQKLDVDRRTKLGTALDG